MVNNGWLRAIITPPQCSPNVTGCFCCIIKLLRGLLTCTNTPCSVIHFQRRYKSDGDRVYSSPWDTKIYEEYSTTFRAGHILLFYVYYEGTTMSKSGTQSLTVIRVRFGNLRPHKEKWLTLGIAPTTTSIPSTLPDQRRLQLKHQLLQRFIFRMMRSLVQASYIGFIHNGSTYFPRVAMLIADQPKERTLLSLKRRDSFTHSCMCTLTSRIMPQQNVPRTPNPASSSSDEYRRSHHQRVSKTNRDGQLSYICYIPNENQPSLFVTNCLSQCTTFIATYAATTYPLFDVTSSLIAHMSSPIPVLLRRSGLSSAP